MEYLYVVQKEDDFLVDSVVSESKKKALEEIQTLGNIVKILPVSSKVFKLSDIDIKNITIDFATLLSSGIQIREVLNILISTKSDRVSLALYRVRKLIDDGKSLSEAFDSNGFSVFFVSSIKSGEKSGNLEGSLRKTAEFYKTTTQVKRNLNTALIEPGITLIVAVIVFLYIIKSAIPTVVSGIKDFNKNFELPFLTKILYGLSGHLFIPFTIAVLVSLFFLFINRYKILYALPVLKKIFLNQDVYLFTSMLEILLSSGINFLDALDIASSSLKSRKLINAVASIKKSVLNGTSVSKAFFLEKDMPLPLKNAIRVGERSGSIEFTLGSYANGVKEQLEYEIKDLVAQLPSLLLVILFPFILSILIAFYLPYFQALAQISTIVGGK